MKLQVLAALCVLMLVASEMAVTSTQAQACDIFKLLPCLPASKDANVAPTPECCANVKALGQGDAGAACLCSLVGGDLAKAQGVVLSIALGIPKECNLPVPKGYVCRGMRVPGG